MRKLRISREIREELLYQLSPRRYLRSLGFEPFGWQGKVQESRHRRKIINGARQSGKSTVVSGKPCHRAKYFPKSLSIIAAATEKQAVEDMEKVKEYMQRDMKYPKIERDSDSLIELENGSRILVIPATEKAARGYSNPDLIILDEASRIEDSVYSGGIIPMLTDNDKCELVLISTPNGKRGFFYRAWHDKEWERYAVRSPWDTNAEGDSLQPSMPEDEYIKFMAQDGIIACYSPRHGNFEGQRLALKEMSYWLYEQEYCCEFVDTAAQVFPSVLLETMYQNGKGGADYKIDIPEEIPTERGPNLRL